MDFRTKSQNFVHRVENSVLVPDGGNEALGLSNYLIKTMGEWFKYDGAYQRFLYDKTNSVGYLHTWIKYMEKLGVPAFAPLKKKAAELAALMEGSGNDAIIDKAIELYDELRLFQSRLMSSPVQSASGSALSPTLVRCLLVVLVLVVALALGWLAFRPAAGQKNTQAMD